MTDTNTQSSKQANVDTRLAELGRIASELDEAERLADELRKRRNQEIYRLRQLADAPTITAIAKVAGVRHGYISRVATDKGAPRSGSSL